LGSVLIMSVFTLSLDPRDNVGLNELTWTNPAFKSSVGEGEKAGFFKRTLHSHTGYSSHTGPTGHPRSAAKRKLQGAVQTTKSISSTPTSEREESEEGQCSVTFSYIQIYIFLHIYIYIRPRNTHRSNQQRRRSARRERSGVSARRSA
jgi:hypothetical protein